MSSYAHVAAEALERRGFQIDPRQFVCDLNPDRPYAIGPDTTGEHMIRIQPAPPSSTESLQPVLSGRLVVAASMRGQLRHEAGIVTDGAHSAQLEIISSITRVNQVHSALGGNSLMALNLGYDTHDNPDRARLMEELQFTGLGHIPVLSPHKAWDDAVREQAYYGTPLQWASLTPDMKSAIAETAQEYSAALSAGEPLEPAADFLRAIRHRSLHAEVLDFMAGVETIADASRFINRVTDWHARLMHRLADESESHPLITNWRRLGLLPADSLPTAALDAADYTLKTLYAHVSGIFHRLDETHPHEDQSSVHRDARQAVYEHFRAAAGQTNVSVPA